MLLTIKFWNKQEFLPTKRHRNIRTRYFENFVGVDITEPNETDFPIAFIVHDFQDVCEGAKDYDDFDNSDFKMFSEEVRTHNGFFYKPVRVTHGAAISTIFESLGYINREIEEHEPYYNNNSEFTENSVVKVDYAEEQKREVKTRSEKFIVFNGVVWERCGEPMYKVMTFGLGHNHGGTGFFITYSYNPNISNKNYFNALEREKAIAYGKQVATNRGDTESIDGIGKNDFIEVLIPEAVKRNPKEEHGNGDEFLNSLEEVISVTDSTLEAGFLAMAMCMK